MIKVSTTKLLDNPAHIQTLTKRACDDKYE